MINLELLKIEFLHPAIDFENYDAIIFTSQNAIKACDAISPKWRDVDSYALGVESFRFASKYTQKCSEQFISANGREFAQKLAPALKGRRVLYPKPQESAHNLKEILKECGVGLDEVVVYKSRCEAIEKEIKNPLIIFTSPKTVRCFLEQFGWHDEYRAIVIGETTQKALPKGAICHVSDEQKLESCVEKAFEIERELSSPREA